MIQYKKDSDITLVEKGIIAHGVNCLGVMGAGVALRIRERWPAVFDAYERNTRLGEQLLGSAHAIRVGDDLWVMNCYTQKTVGPRGTGRYADPAAIRRSLEFGFSHANATGLPLHAPRIGCDFGGLDWGTEVLPIFEELNSVYDGVNVVIHTI